MSRAAESPRLVVADVDGTLVTPEKALTPASMEAVRRVRDAGILFTITSGRPPKGMKMLIDALRLTQPIAAFNGGILVHPDLSPISTKFLPAEAAAKVISTIAADGLDVWVYSDAEWFVRNLQAPHVETEQWTVKFQPRVVAAFDAGLLARTVKIVGVSDDFEAVARCEKHVQQACGAQVSATRSQQYYLDVTHPQANKGEVVTALSELLRVPTENIATIGDMPNDVLMFRRSGLSIAMGNASPQVQQAARFVTSSNREEGFARAMERFILAANPSPAIAQA